MRNVFTPDNEGRKHICRCCVHVDVFRDEEPCASCCWITHTVDLNGYLALLFAELERKDDA